mmetsp:Transcript_14755/g.32606  ORF Transcript_14755/g.32606 Transcript_14755/m.32606 type:complete len:83 (+) Transcript_14755:2510-2758(+)
MVKISLQFNEIIDIDILKVFGGCFIIVPTLTDVQIHQLDLYKYLIRSHSMIFFCLFAQKSVAHFSIILIASFYIIKLVLGNF